MVAGIFKDPAKNCFDTVHQAVEFAQTLSASTPHHEKEVDTVSNEAALMVRRTKAKDSITQPLDRFVNTVTSTIMRKPETENEVEIRSPEFTSLDDPADDGVWKTENV